MTSCKVCKIKNYEIVEYIDLQLKLGKSYRAIARDVIEKFKYPISYQSIRRHHLHMKERKAVDQPKQESTSQDYSPVFGVSARPLRR